jgi:urease accessory protein
MSMTTAIPTPRLPRFIPAMIDDRALLQPGPNVAAEILGWLFLWFSPTFPTGGFAYSHGLETAVAEQRVSGEAGLAGWLEDILGYGAGWTDSVLLTMAYAAADEQALLEVCALAAALAPSRERSIETLRQGEAFLSAIRVGWPWAAAAALPFSVAYPVAAGAVGEAAGAPLEMVLLAYLTGFASNLVGAGVRLGVCGQLGGLRILSRLGPLIATLSTKAKTAGEGDLGGCALMSDLVSMRHEVQSTRLFVT